MAMTDADVARVESLCTALFGPDANARARADQELAPLCRLEGIGQLRMVMERSNDAMAHYFVAATLLRLVTDCWTGFNVEQQLQMQQWLLGVIWVKGPTMQRHNANAFVQVLCRLTKFGWLDSQHHQELPGRLIQEVLANRSAAPLGLNVLITLVSEVNTLASRHSVTQHRKTSVSFRDICLFDMFKAALTILQGVRTDASAADPQVCEQALKLALECLTFDFVGIFPDESTDEAGTVQLPMAWRPVVLEQNVLSLFLELYSQLPPPRSTDCMRCLNQVATIRRSFFNNDEERKAWLQHILAGALVVLQQKKGLNDPDNYFEFCRLLSRIKPNYQLSELVSADAYGQWVELCAQFTIQSFINWRSTGKSHFFLLTLWSRLVSSQPYLKGGDKPSLLETFIPQVADAYIKSRLELARAVVCDPGCVDDPTDHQDNLIGHLELIPVLVRSVYGQIGPLIISLLNPIVADLQAGTQIQQLTEEMAKQFAILESQLGWLVYIMGAVVGHHVSGTSTAEAEKMDGEMTAGLFNMCNTVRARTSMPGAERSETLQGLEKAILYFLQSFRKVHIGESSMPCSKVYPRLQELTGVKDHLDVLNLIINKVVSNLKVWRTCSPIVGETLTLFCDLSSGYSSGRFLLKLPAIRYMLENHSGPDFPFLQDQFNTPHRSKFYRTLANLLFMETTAESAFERFMRPLKEVCLQLEAVTQREAFREVAVKRGVVGLLRDLRGVCAACTTKRMYTLLFEWLSPAHLDLLQRCAQVYVQDNDVILPLLKVFADLVHNRSQRISFEPNSPNGILLFKKAAELLLGYGHARLAMTLPANLPAKDLYNAKYKGYCTCMNILQRCLAGNFCNFGAMSYYHDDTLDQTLAVVIKMALSIPLEDLLSLEKLGSAYYTLLETLYSNHCQTMASLDSRAFLQLVHSLEEATRSVQLPRAAVCNAMAAVGHLMSFYFAQMQKQTPCAHALSQHFSLDSDLLVRVLNAIFHAVLFEESNANQWAMSRPMLPLILINPAFYEEYQRKLLAALAPDKVPRLQEAFAKLMEGVERNLEAKNRDKFTQNVTTFRHLAKSVL
eukprot:EG_transcript_991